MSMTLYLFHLYFVSGTRVALERWHPGTPLAVHLVAGTLAGCLGPWIIFQVLKGRRCSTGASATPPARRRSP